MILFWKLQIKLVLSRYLSFHRQVNVASVDHLQFNRPKALNSFGGKLIEETINAIRELNERADTVFTVLTGEGRFFSAGADIRGKLALFTMAKYEDYQKNWSLIICHTGSDLISTDLSFKTEAEAKLAFLTQLLGGTAIFSTSLFPTSNLISSYRIAPLHHRTSEGFRLSVEWPRSRWWSCLVYRCSRYCLGGRLDFLTSPLLGPWIGPWERISNQFYPNHGCSSRQRLPHVWSKAVCSGIRAMGHC